MKEQLIFDIQKGMTDYLTASQQAELRNVLRQCFRRVRIEKVEDEMTQMQSELYLNMYLSAKTVEGCSSRTLAYYGSTIRKMLEYLGKEVQQIHTEDLRMYLAKLQDQNGVSHVTMDNVRRVFTGFFAWLEDENYIEKSPARRIHKVKAAQIIKETFSDEELELLRNACACDRDRVIIEFLSTTGVRVGELVGLNRDMVNFYERSCVVFGKGQKEREVYFDAKTKLHLQQYLSSRTDSNEALFVSMREPHGRLTINGIEKMLGRLGDKTGIANVHPHKFRRTLATMAIDKGMPIEQVQKLLGHVRIDTTMNYAMVNQINVKNAHRKYIG